MEFIKAGVKHHSNASFKRISRRVILFPLSRLSCNELDGTDMGLHLTLLPVSYMPIAGQEARRHFMHPIVFTNHIIPWGLG
jgi:hypothetical protein